MDEPIVFISRMRLRDGAAETFAALFRNAVAAIAEAKPRTAVFAAYLDRGHSHVAVVHVFPDADAMLDHFAGSADRANSIADLVEYVGFEAYGAAPRAAIDQLARDAEATGAPLSTFPDEIGGYLTVTS